MIGNTVLIVVDQTPDADVVLREGLELCDKLGVKPAILTTVTVNDSQPSGTTQNLSDKTNQQDIDQTRNENLQNSIRDRITQLIGSTHDFEILTPSGDAAREIRRAATTMGADLIIIGNHAESGLGLFLGSTANVVLHDTPCHVLAVTLRPS